MTHPSFTVIDGSGSPGQRAEAAAIRDQYDFGPPPNLGAGLRHSVIGALCGLVSLSIFFVLSPTSQVGGHWPVLVLIGALIGWFLRYDPNGDQ